MNVNNSENYLDSDLKDVILNFEDDNDDSSMPIDDQHLEEKTENISDEEDSSEEDDHEEIDGEIVGNAEDFFVRDKWKLVKTIEDVKNYVVEELGRINKNVVDVKDKTIDIWSKPIYSVISNHGVLLELLVNSEFDLNLKRFYDHEEVFSYTNLSEVASAIYDLLETS